MSDAARRLATFATDQGDYIGPLMAAYGGPGVAYAEAQEALKSDILALLAEVRQLAALTRPDGDP
jgi:hypothetical protein